MLEKIMSISYSTNPGYVINNVASHTLSSLYLDNHVNINSASEVIITIPSGLGTPGQTVDYFQQGSGQITFSPASGVSLLSYSGFNSTKGLYAGASLRLIASNSWALVGDII